MNQKISMIVITIFLLGANSYALQPDEHRPSCAATPDQLYQKPDTLSLLQRAKTGPTLNLNSMTGTWQVQGLIIRKDQIGVNIRRDGFVVQIKDIVRNASICTDELRAGWLRIVLHEPRCPENKNIYVKVLEPGMIEIEAYQTRLIGSAVFKRVSQNPILKVKPYKRPPCARDWRG